MAFDLASFPNSRIQPRAATKTVSDPVDIAILPEGTGATPGGNTQLLGQNLNRTYVSVYNRGPDDLRMNRNDAPITFAAGDGFLIPAGSSYDIEGPEPIYMATVALGTCNVSFEEGSG